jgi:hypothetical protein
MQTHIRSLLLRPMQSLHSLSLGQSRWLFSGIAMVDIGALLFKFLRDQSMVFSIGPFADLRASTWHVLIPELVYFGLSTAFGICLSFVSWAAWRREQNFVHQAAIRERL